MTFSVNTPYRLINSAFNKVLELDSDDLRFGTFVRCRIATGASTVQSNQVFMFKPVGNGRYQICSYVNPQCVLGYQLVGEFTVVMGIGFVNWTHYPVNKLWRVYERSQNVVEIIGASSNSSEPLVPTANDLLLDVYGISIPAIQDVSVVEYRHKDTPGIRWELEEVPSEALPQPFPLSGSGNNGYFRIANLDNPNMVLTLDSRNRSIELTSGDVDRQRFYEVSWPDGSYSYRSYVNEDMYLTCFSSSNRGAVGGAYWIGEANQKWQKSQRQDGSVALLSCVSDGMYCLDLNGSASSIASGSRCVMWQYDGGSTQLWHIETVGQHEQTPIVRFRSDINNNLRMALDADDNGDGALALLNDISSSSVATQMFTDFVLEEGGVGLQRKNSSLILTTTGHSHDYMLLGRVPGSMGERAWTFASTRGAAYAVISDLPDDHSFCMKGLGLHDSGKASGVIRALSFRKTTEERTAQWMFEKLFSPLDGMVRVCRLKTRIGSTQRCLRVGATSGSAGRQVSFAAISAETNQLFRMHINVDRTCTFESLAYPDYVLAVTSVVDNQRAAVIPAGSCTVENRKWRCFMLLDGTFDVRLMADARFSLVGSSLGTYSVLTNSDDSSSQWEIEVLETVENNWANDAVPGDEDENPDDWGDIPGPNPGGTDPDEPEEPEEPEPSGSWQSLKLAYRIRNVSNPALTVRFASANVASGSTTCVDSSTDAPYQLFVLRPEGDDTCSIRSVANEAIALAAEAPHDYYRPIVGRAYTGAASQRWRIVQQAAGDYRILNADNDDWMLDTRDGPSQSGSECIQWPENNGTTQRWTLEPVALNANNQVVAEGFSAVRICSVTGEGIVLGIGEQSGVNVAVPQYASDSVGQVFLMQTGGNDTVRFVSQGEAGLVLAVHGVLQYDSVYADEPSGASFMQAPKQFWRYVLQTDGTYRIFSAYGNNAYLLDTTGGNTSLSSRIIVWNEVADNSQKWLFEPMAQTGSAGSGDGDDDQGEGGDNTGGGDGSGEGSGEPNPPTPGSGDSDESIELYYIRNVCTPSVVLQFDASPAVQGCSISTAYPDRGLNQLFVKHVNNDGTVSFLDYPGQSIALSASGYFNRSYLAGSAFDPDNPSAGQKWSIEQRFDGSQRLYVQSGSGRWYLDTNGAVTGHGSEGILWESNSGTTQRWTLEQVSVASGDASVSAYPLVRIRSICTPSVAVEVDIESASSVKATRTVTVAAADAQLFSLVGTGDGRYVFLNAANPDLALTARNPNYRSDVTAEVLECTTEANDLAERASTAIEAQCWRIIAQADGTYHIASGNGSVSLLDTNGAVTSDGSGCIMWSDNGGTTQKWVVEYVALAGN